MIRNAKLASLSAALLAWPVMARADDGSTANTLGGVIARAFNDVWTPFWLLLLGLAGLVGLWLIATGLIKLKDAGESHARGTMAEGVLRCFGGAALLALPDTLNIGLASFYGAVTGHVVSGSRAAVGGVQNCLDANAGGLTCVATNVATNFVPVFEEVSFGIMFLYGAFRVFKGIHDLSTSNSQGQQRLPEGWWAGIVLGILLCNASHLFTLVQVTFGIANGSITDAGMDPSSDMLKYTTDGSSAILAQYADLITQIFRILVAFGMITAWRGILLLHAHHTGQGRGGVGQAVTHIVGGVVLMNIKWFVCIVASTTFGSGSGFC